VKANVRVNKGKKRNCDEKRISLGLGHYLVGQDRDFVPSADFFLRQGVDFRWLQKLESFSGRVCQMENELKSSLQIHFFSLNLQG
jgi:hypothetical protein